LLEARRTMKFTVVSAFAIVSLASCARIHQNQASENPYNKGWAPGKSRFVCTEKWELNAQQGTDSWCLADLDDIEKALTSSKAKFHFTSSWSRCASNKKRYAMRLCKLKGKKDNMRVSYKNRAFIPKACFKKIPKFDLVVGQAVYDVFQAHLTKAECDTVISQNLENRGQFAK